MAKSEDLRRSVLQHRPKNLESKKSDKEIHKAVVDCIAYLEKRLASNLVGYRLTFTKSVSYRDLIAIIESSGQRFEFDKTFLNREIIPDGGVVWLEKENDDTYRKVVLVSEVKKQGTNKERISEGKPKQAQGNAIERLGKNLTGIRAAMNHEKITPFVCFGWGCDFDSEYTNDSFVMSKISMMNEFYPLNRTYVFKKDGSSDKNHFAPVSMYFREPEWTREEMFPIIKEVAETSLRFYLF